VNVWDPRTLKLVDSYSPHDKSLYGTAVSKDGLVAVGGNGKEAIVYDLSKKKEIVRLRFDDSTPRYVKFTPDGNRLVLGTTNGTIEVYSTADWKSLKQMKAPESITNLSISADGKNLLAGGINGTVTMWDLERYELKHKLIGHRAAVFGIDFHPSGQRAVTVGYDQNVKVWDTNTGKLLITIRGFENNLYCAGFFNEGKSLLVTQTNGIVNIL
ncbi:MAG: hypothetical protein HKN25_16035, partial [Pyrinomonadaceae bacterium]|nr:hypothetical protein [Pyrinomonadaceae bacterium]